ncbi:MAG: hypothetical protein HC829_02620 [Bacteroidales bacterium]|nr:hypothetical protein [Bacteroidales bacterium]
MLIGTGLVTGLGSKFYIPAAVSESWTRPAGSILTDAAALAQEVNTAVGVVTLPGGITVDNSYLDVGCTNWADGAPTYSSSTIGEVAALALGGRGIDYGYCYAGFNDINASDLTAVLRNYITTGECNPARQETQAAVNSGLLRLDADACSTTATSQYSSNGLDVATRNAACSAEAGSMLCIDPLVLDLDGNGIEMTSWITENIFFDTVGDGKLHQTGWVAGADGILSLDLKGNGVIDDITETVSVHFNAGATPGAYADGIAALAAASRPDCQLS